MALRFHSVTGLVSNSSGEVFVVKRGQMPENVNETINSLWRLWATQHADQWDKEFVDRMGLDWDASSIFGVHTPAFNQIDIDSGCYEPSDSHYRHIEPVAEFFRKVGESDRRAGLPGELDSASVWRALGTNEDILMLANLYMEYKDLYDQEMKAYHDVRQENPDSANALYPAWFYMASHHLAELVIEADLFDEVENMAYLFATSEGAWGQWRWVKSSFDRFHAYEDAEFVGEVDDHVYPQQFVYFVCNTLGWYVYHNG